MVAVSAVLPVLQRIQPVLFGAGRKKDADTEPNSGAPRGSKVRLWKQDPTVEAIGIRTAWLPDNVQAGPKDEFIEIRNMRRATPNENGDFLYDNATHPNEFDAVHTFSVVRKVLTMFQRALNRMGVTDHFGWQWDDGTPLKVYPHAGETANAYYTRQGKSLKFFYITPNHDISKRVYTARSFDIVAHESGHAVLDSLKPGWMESWHPQTGGMHESFGDLSAIFNMLAQLDMCEAIITESKCNLHDKSFFPQLAEQFGEALGRPMGLRNADNNLKLSDVGTEVHAISQVFTGAIYNILADEFKDSLQLGKEDPAATLTRVGEHLVTNLLDAIIKSPEKNATFRDVAEKMIALEPNPKWKDFILQRFTEREVFGQTAAKEITPQRLDWSGTCPSLQRPEHKKRFNQAVREAKLALQQRQ